MDSIRISIHAYKLTASILIDNLTVLYINLNMNPNNAALQFIKSLVPLAEDLKWDFRKKLAIFLIYDLDIIIRRCTAPSDSLTDDEWPIISLTLASIITVIAGEPFDPFTSEAQIIKYLKNWNNQEPGKREKIEGELKKSSEILFTGNTGTGKESEFVTPPAVHIMDNRYGSDYYQSVITALYRFAQSIISVHDTTKEKKEAILKDIWEKLFHLNDYDAQRVYEKADKAIKRMDQKESGINETNELQEKDDKDSLQNALKELDELIGLDKLKKEVRTLINFLQIQKERSKRGLGEQKTSLHAVFYGPPGTGKTSVARILSKIYKHMGFLQEGHLIETDRAGLVGSYIGHTSEKTEAKVAESIGGVLFIDEAYALKPEDDSGSDFGQEAIDLLIKRMEDNRENLVIIVAGYPDEMKRFIESNPGLQSRFNRYFYFDHYSPKDLLEILKFSVKRPTIVSPLKLKRSCLKS